MAQKGLNIFNPGKIESKVTDDINLENDTFEFEKTDDAFRDKVRSNIFKALTNSSNIEDLKDKAYPPKELTELIENEMINQFKKSDSSTYKATSNNVIKRLSGQRFEHVRQQLASGEFPVSDFIKGKMPKASSKPATTAHQDPSSSDPSTFGSSNPINRNRRINPPFPGRGARRGGPRGMRGSRGGPMRGGMAQTRVPRPELQSEKPAIPEEIDNKELVADKGDHKEQPATQLPIETKERDLQNTSVNESKMTKDIAPTVVRVQENSVVSNKDLNSAANDVPPKLPMTSHRRGQPSPGNHNAPPPIMSRNRGVRTLPKSNPHHKQPPSQTQVNQKVEIIEEEIVHEEVQSEAIENDQTRQSVQTSSFGNEIENTPAIQQPPDQTQNQINYNHLEENKTFIESENKKQQVKEMFGQMFENDSSDTGAKSRNRSPNFSDQRRPSQDESDGPLQKFKASKPNRKTKTNRKYNELNKSVEIFGTLDNRFETEPLINDQKDALNTSFGIENCTDDYENLEAEEILQSTEKIFASSQNEDPIRSRTPPIEAKRSMLKPRDQDPKFHEPIGAQEDFVIEEPVVEPPRDEKNQPNNENKQLKPDTDKIMSKEIETKHDNLISSSSIKNELVSKDLSKTSKDQFSKSVMNDNLEEIKNESDLQTPAKSSKSNYGSSVSTIMQGTAVNNLKASAISNFDNSIPISHTSSVRSLPDETERLNENLKLKKQECEELKLLVHQKDNELQVQKQTIEELKHQLENQRAK